MEGEPREVFNLWEGKRPDLQFQSSTVHVSLGNGPPWASVSPGHGTWLFPGAKCGADGSLSQGQVARGSSYSWQFSLLKVH